MTPKNAQTFHDRSAQQIDDFKKCVEETSQDLLSGKGLDKGANVAADKGNNKGKSNGKGKGKESGIGEGQPLWFRASQICAHDRYQFGKVLHFLSHSPVYSLSFPPHTPSAFLCTPPHLTPSLPPFHVLFLSNHATHPPSHPPFHSSTHILFHQAGWGRLSIGLYSLYLEKWLEHFAPDQFLITRLEDYERDPKAYMNRLFVFLGVQLDELEQGNEIIKIKRENLVS